MAWRWIELGALLAAALKVVVALHVLANKQERRQHARPLGCLQARGAP